MYNSDWYNSLIRPFLAPPSFIFTPVWIVLYITLAIALILYVTEFSIKNKKSGYIYFAAQLLLNLVWSPVFFGMKNILLALIIILLMDLFVILTIKQFYSISKLAGIILIPYLLWILFATYLNIGYFVLN